MTKKIVKLAGQSLLRGAASVVDVTGCLYNGSFCVKHSDFDAIKSDWDVTGKDIGAAFAAFDRKEANATKQ